ncbi:chondroadherin-like protein isoform X2 [Pristis pectinata]|nr:chondroadherin-like protein isoform X2 [Pristis pectinata]XP_051899116.1 chondroadherin-like protein isoform X2 [Pristis pectinata]XP_051899117.1 chondroadherin-like protein isoform X2 [Pristis pectinata]
MPFLRFLVCSVALVQYFTLTAETSVNIQCPKGCSCSAYRQHISCTNISLADIPTQLPEITSQLRLSSEHLPEIPANAFLSLSGLTILYLNNNNISRLKPGAFNGLNQLEFLHLNNNSIEELEVGAFENVTTLAFLHLENNLLTDIVPGVFSSLTKLNVLDLRNNRLTTVADLTFKSLSALRWLLLSNNQITTISSKAFAGNRVLRKLCLNNNNLTTVPLRALRALRRLEILQLSNNNMSSLKSIIFEPKLKFLSELYLDNTFLDEDPAQALSRLRKLEILSMRNNRLVTLSYTKSFKSVKWFGLSGNAWRCDCQLIWLRAWLLKQTEADQREVMCSSPSPHSGKLLVNVQPQFLTCPPYSFEVATTPSLTAKNKTSTPRGPPPPPQGTAQALPPKVSSKQTIMKVNTIEKALPMNLDPCLSNQIKQVTVSEVTTTTLLVNWDVLKDMGDDYEVRYSTVTQVQRLRMIGGVREVELSQLNAGTVYKICVIPQSNIINKCHQPASNQCSEAHTSGNTESVQSKNALVGGITVMVILLITIALIAAFKLKSRHTGFQRHYDEDASTYIEHFEKDQSKVDFDHINSAFEEVTDDSNVHFSHLAQSPKVEDMCTLDCYIAPEAEFGATLKCTSLSNDAL